MSSKKRKLQEKPIVTKLKKNEDTINSITPQRRSRRLQGLSVPQEISVPNQSTISSIKNPIKGVLPQYIYKKGKQSKEKMIEKQPLNSLKQVSKEVVSAKLNKVPKRNSTEVANRLETTHESLNPKSKTSILKKEVVTPNKIHKNLNPKSKTSTLKKDVIAHNKIDGSLRKNDEVKTELPSVGKEAVEVIDLVNEEVLYTVLRFARANFENVEFLIAVLPEDVPTKARIVEVESLNVAEAFIADIHFHLDDAFVDLTQDSDDDQVLVIASEKECANRILETVYNCHMTYLFTKKGERAVQKISVAGEEEIRGFGLKCDPNQIAPLGQTLIKILSNIVVVNLKLTRFLQILSMKLNIKYDVEIKPKFLFWYLYAMLDMNRELCHVGVMKELLGILNAELPNFQRSTSGTSRKRKVRM